jgi:hypothetical protein
MANQHMYEATEVVKTSKLPFMSLCKAVQERQDFYGDRMHIFFGILDSITETKTRSTRNTRIERLWVEVGSQFLRRWKAFFVRLEKRHNLIQANSNHLWLLHTLFLGLINEDAKTFQEEWNSHPISGVAGSRTPLVRHK